jgi:hypothetical protein
MYKWSHVAAIGFFAGLASGVITYNMISGGHGLIAVFAAVVGEASQRVFYAHSDTHLDPPAAAIVVWSLTLGLLVIAGLLNWAVWIPGTGI